jgi:hypothetical protein
MTMRIIVSQPDPTAPSTGKQGISPRERLDRLASVGADRMAAAMTFLAGYDAGTFDAILDAVEPCDENGDPDAGEDAEPFCSLCGADIGIFLRLGLDWQHYRGDGTTRGPIEVFDEGHVPVVAWHPARTWPTDLLPTLFGKTLERSGAAGWSLE